MIGVVDPTTRFNLVWNLGVNIDKRGGDAAGFTASTTEGIHVGKRPGYWTLAKRKFIARAASGHANMLHSRYATCGKKEISEAHPFVIRRNNRTALYGCHNGMVYNAAESAKKHNRKIVVDSEEIFQLLADKDFDGIKNLEGYGVITYVDPKDPLTINMLRLSTNSDIYVVSLDSGGVVYGSTKSIVNEALEKCKVTARCYYDLEVGRIYHFRDDGVYKSKQTGIVFAERKYTSSYGSYSIGKRYGNWSWLEKQYAKDYGFDLEGDDVDPPESEDVVNETTTVDSDTYAMQCESCGEDVDEDTADYVSFQFEEYFGRKDTPILCVDCLYDAGNAAMKSGA